MKMKLQSTTVQSTAMLFLLAMMTSLLAAEPVKTKGKATQQKVAKEQIAKEKTTKGKSTTKGKGVKVKAANKIVLPANFESIKKSTFQGVRLSSQQRREVDTLTKYYSSRLSAAAQVRGKTSTDAKLRQEFRTALRKILTAAQKKQQQAKNSQKTKSLAAKKQPAAKQISKTTEISQKVPTKITKKKQPTTKTTKKIVANKKQPVNKKDTVKTAKASSKSGTRTTKTAKKKPPQDD